MLSLQLSFNEGVNFSMSISIANQILTVLLEFLKANPGSFSLFNLIVIFHNDRMDVLVPVIGN